MTLSIAKKVGYRIGKRQIVVCTGMNTMLHERFCSECYAAGISCLQFYKAFRCLIAPERFDSRRIVMVDR